MEVISNVKQCLHAVSSSLAWSGIVSTKVKATHSTIPGFNLLDTLPYDSYFFDGFMRWDMLYPTPSNTFIFLVHIYMWMRLPFQLYYVKWQICGFFLVISILQKPITIASPKAITITTQQAMWKVLFFTTPFAFLSGIFFFCDL